MIKLPVSNSLKLSAPPASSRRNSEPCHPLTENDEKWKQRCVRQQIDDELNRRVRDALETPPLERLRRRQLQQQAREAAAAKRENEDLNAHLDLTEKERDFLASRRRQQARLKLSSRADSVPDLHQVTEGNFNRFMSERYGQDVDNADIQTGRVYEGEGYQQRPDHVQANGYRKYDDWEFDAARRSQKPTYPDGTAPVIPHPKLKNIIHPYPEPLYTSIPVVPGAKTFDNQDTPYTQKWRGICIVYDSEKSKRDQTTAEPPRNPLYAPHLIFESRFESGNLRQARRVGQFEYELVLKTDVFTKRHTQWFYFRVRNMVPGVIYKFRIVNLLKRDSLYNHGMRPLFYSERDADYNNIGWIRHGHHISYSRNVQHTICPLLSRELTYYELEWQMEFPHESDTCYLAHCYPYSYTDLKNDLDSLLADPIRSQYAKRDVMCETKVGNNCYLLTVTDFDCREKKKYIVVSARVHPGESNASWMLKGLVDFITGDSKEANEIRRKFVYKIVPMLNPDGVIVGNYRCSLQARDLNRNYRHPRRDNFPTVFNVKRLVENLAETVGVFVYCDFHGHSRKANVFMYGNNTSAKEAGNVRAFLEERMLPYCISKVANGLFHYESCKFQIRRCKESTGRVVMYRAYEIKNSFTMEATFCGTQIDKDGSRHFNQGDFMESGKYFALGCMEYHRLNEDKQKETEVILDLTRVITQQIIAASKLQTEDQATAAEDLEAVLQNHLNPHPKKSSQFKGEGSGEDDIPHSLITDQSSNEKRANVIKVLDSITEETIAKCVNLLEKLSIPTEAEESESSDSDSESESEVPEEKSKKKKKSKGKKKKDKKQGLPIIGGQDGDYKGGSSRLDGRNSRAHWSNPYQGRSNGGIPCFSEERSMERAAKRMAELQKRMEEKTARTHTFGPFSERDYFSDRDTLSGVNRYYDDLEAEQKQAEEDYNRSLKTFNPHNFVKEKNHMDFTQPNPDSATRKSTDNNLAPNTNQFEMTLKRSRTDMFDAKRYNRWQRTSVTPEQQHKLNVDTWSEADTRAKMYHGSHHDVARNSSGNERVKAKLPPHILNTNSSMENNGPPPQSTKPAAAATSTTNIIHHPGAHIFEPSTNTNPLHMLTREYTEILASRLRASQNKSTPTKSQVNRSNLLKALHVNPLHAQPGLE